jgi:NTP pyrophosphatase (non-canonical NTP hydrolase)
VISSNDPVEALTPPEVEGLKKTQDSFMDYQLRAFGQRSASFFALELAGECGELANLEKKIWRDPAHCGVGQQSIADEAADVFIALMNYCNARQISLEQAVTSKLARIEERRRQGRMGPIPPPSGQ